MRRDPDFFEDRQLALIYIAKRLTEAVRLEGVLTAGGVDYAVEPDTYKGGVIFASERIGAFFYVLPDVVEPARTIMLSQGFKMNQGED
jgi:hypothetical protein